MFRYLRQHSASLPRTNKNIKINLQDWFRQDPKLLPHSVPRFSSPRFSSLCAPTIIEHSQQKHQKQNKSGEGFKQQHIMKEADCEARHDRPVRGVPRPAREVVRDMSRLRNEAPHRSRLPPLARRRRRCPTPGRATGGGSGTTGAAAWGAQVRDPLQRSPARVPTRPFLTPRRTAICTTSPAGSTGRRERKVGRRRTHLYPAFAEVVPTSAAPDKATHHSSKCQRSPVITKHFESMKEQKSIRGNERRRTPEFSQGWGTVQGMPTGAFPPRSCRVVRL